MGKKITPKFSGYLYQWTNYAEDFDIVRNLRRKGGNSPAGERLAFINSRLEESSPKPQWLVCARFQGGEWKIYALCKLRMPTDEEIRFHAEEKQRGTRAFEKYVYVDEGNSFIVALPGDEGVFDLPLNKLLQDVIGKRNGQLQGANGLEIQIDDFYIERLKRRQILTIADRIKQLEQDRPGEETVFGKPPSREDAEDGGVPDTEDSSSTNENPTTLDGNRAEASLDGDSADRDGDSNSNNNTDSDKFGSQCYESDPEMRRVIEQHAVSRAKNHYKNLGYAVEEFGKPFDLLCKKGDEIIHVEVKGSRMKLNAVTLTINEVNDAENATWQSDLFVVDQIVVDDSGEKLVPSGGVARVIHKWIPAREVLLPTEFRYQLPEESHWLIVD